jgi:hypothetical protein
MTREQAKDLCEALAAEMIGKLRKSNEAWDSYHGVVATVSDREYQRAEKEITGALWRRTGFSGCSPTCVEVGAGECADGR